MFGTFRGFRILVPSDSVGAIIGKQGSTVKQIKQAAHAKYDSKIEFDDPDDLVF